MLSGKFDRADGAGSIRATSQRGALGIRNRVFQACLLWVLVTIGIRIPQSEISLLLISPSQKPMRIANANPIG